DRDDELDRAGVRGVGGDRPGLRAVPGDTRGEAGSCDGPALRVRRVAVRGPQDARWDYIIGMRFPLILALLLVTSLDAQSKPAAEMSDKQAVVETTAGTFVIELRPDLAPAYVSHFIQQARQGAYDGTVFHRLVKHGIIQGGDPLSKDPSKAKAYGTGRLGKLKAEFNSEPATRGAVAAVLQPGKPDSAGSQFFVCVSDQPALTGK